MLFEFVNAILIGKRLLLTIVHKLVAKRLNAFVSSFIVLALTLVTTLLCTNVVTYFYKL